MSRPRSAMEGVLAEESLVERYKKRSKRLLKAIKAGESPEWAARFRSFYGDVEPVLTRVQQLVAVAAGFANWGHLIDAEEDELRAGLDKVPQ